MDDGQFRKIVAFIAPCLAFTGGVSVGYLLGADPSDITIRTFLVSMLIVGTFSIFACWPPRQKVRG
jgi:uncharacterized membrane protein YoaK (UPF0700 family)